MAMTVEKKTRGRPRMAGELKKARNVTIRVRDGVYEQISAAAAAAGRSLSEEMELRIVQSFDRPAVIGDLARHLWREMAAVIGPTPSLAAAKDFAFEEWGEHWTRNEWDALREFVRVACSSAPTSDVAQKGAIVALSDLFDAYGEARTDYGPAPTDPDIATPQAAALKAFGIVMGAKPDAPPAEGRAD